MARKDRRAEMITAAHQLFYTKGYENTSINDIINTVGVSKGAFYHHFDSKQAVMMAVVDVLVVQTEAVIRPILANPNLPAIDKFGHMARVVNSWKIEQRDQMLDLMRVMFSDENLQLQHKLVAHTMRIAVPALAQILEQGSQEGVFDLDGVDAVSSAEFIIAILRAADETMIELLLDTNRPDNASTLAINKYATAQKMMERILNAPAGSLSFIDQDAFARWFV